MERADPHLSLLAPEHSATLPSPPIPPDPMSIPCLATLPVDPSLDFRSFTSLRSSGPRSPQLTPPVPTSCDRFGIDDPLRHIVRTTSGKIFSIAAEIAAVNANSTLRPVGMVLFPKPEIKVGKVKGRMDRKKRIRSNRKAEDTTKQEDESEEDREDGEGWLGKDEGFVSTRSLSFTPS